MTDAQIAALLPQSSCLGWRPYDPVNKTFGPYEWMDYQTVQKRRTALGRALVELHEEIGITGRQYGIGLWCQNRPEWQVMGRCLINLGIEFSLLTNNRSSLHVPITF